MPRTRPTSAPATLPTIAPRTPVASALARLAGQPLRARHREDDPITGIAEMNGLNVELVIIPPGGTAPDDRQGYTIMNVVDMDRGFRVAIVSLGLTDESIRGTESHADWTAKKYGTARRKIDYKEREYIKMNSFMLD
jgi:hypothetical protein